MESYAVNKILKSMLQSIDKTTKMVKDNEAEMENLKKEYEIVIQYNTDLAYSNGFWDGFWYGGCLMTSIMGGMIYFLQQTSLKGDDNT
jgi:hypothetical protein